MSRVVLISLIGGINIDIIPHFISYYKNIGVDEFKISVNIQENRFCDIEKVKYILKEFNIEPLHIWIGRFNRLLKRSFMQFAKDQCIEDDWILRADQDEFSEFKIGLKNLINKCEKDGYSYVEGERIERIAVGGYLASIKEFDIFKQFPIKGIIKDGYGYGKGLINESEYRKKIVLAKKRVDMKDEGSFHFVKNDIALERYYDTLEINHFRWNNNIIKDWERRMLWSSNKNNIRRTKQIDYIFKDKNTIDMEKIKVL